MTSRAKNSISKVVFLSVKKPQEKLMWLFKVATRYFSEKKKLLFLCDSLESEQFVYDLFWRDTKSFLPIEKHSATMPTSFLVATYNTDITQQYASIFNLTKTPLTESKNLFNKIYEFDTDSQKKMLAYKDKGYLIVSP